MVQAQPPLEFIPPQFNPLVYQPMRWLMPSYLRWGLQIPQIQVNQVERLAELYHQFQAGKIRFLLAFRHPDTRDPFCLFHLLSNLVPQAARRHHIPLQGPIHAHFIYDRGIPLWAGAQVGWLCSNLGGTPIMRGRVDRAGLRSARELFANGQFPLAAAPEGATNGHNELISPLEPGIAQMGFWCAEDLQKAGRQAQVLIVPLGLHYRFTKAPWMALEQLTRQLEAEAGLPPGPPVELPTRDDAPVPTALYERLLRLGESLLTLMENFYREYYHQPLPVQLEAPASTTPQLSEIPTSNRQIITRLQVLLDTALKVAEQYFNLEPRGNFIDRCRRLEQAGWDWIYREDFKHLETLSPLQRGLADRIAEEATLRMWHMRLVESFVALTGYYVLEKPTAERFAETALLTWELIVRIKGGSPFQRPQLGPQSVQITVGEPLSVSDRWPQYQASRRSAKQAIADLTQDLQTALEAMIP